MKPNPKIERALLEVMSRVREPRDSAAICWHLPQHHPLEVDYVLSTLALRGVLEISLEPGEQVKYRLAHPIAVTEALGMDAMLLARLSVFCVLGATLVLAIVMVVRAWMGVPS